MNGHTVTLRERITLEAIRRHLRTTVLVIGLAPERETMRR
jgi:hypothetical protein